MEDLQFVYKSFYNKIYIIKTDIIINIIIYSYYALLDYFNYKSTKNQII
jgi:hypothetical protein